MHTRRRCRDTLVKSKLDQAQLMRAWQLADNKNAGRLTRSAFCICMHLVYKALAGETLPNSLPSECAISVTDLSNSNSNSINIAKASPNVSQQPSPSSTIVATPKVPEVSTSNNSLRSAATANSASLTSVENSANQNNQHASSETHNFDPWSNGDIAQTQQLTKPSLPPPPEQSTFANFDQPTTVAATQPAFTTSFNKVNKPQQSSTNGNNLLTSSAFDQNNNSLNSSNNNVATPPVIQKLPAVAPAQPTTQRMERTSSMLSNTSHTSGRGGEESTPVAPKLAQAPSNASISSVASAASSVSPYYIPQDKRELYQGFFDKEKTVDDFIEGAAARTIFIQSSLPLEFLGQVWNLVDLEQTGRLSEPQFVLAMHFLSLKLTHNIPPPNSLSDKEIVDFYTGGNSQQLEQFQDPEDLAETISEIEELKAQKRSLTDDVLRKEEALNEIRKNTEKLQDSIDEINTTLTNLGMEKIRRQRQLDNKQVERSECSVTREDVMKKREEGRRVLMGKQNEHMEAKGKQTKTTADEERLNRIIQATANIKPRLSADEYELQRGNIKIKEQESELARIALEIGKLESEKDQTQSNIDAYSSKLSELQIKQQSKSNGIAPSTSFESSLPEKAELAESTPDKRSATSPNALMMSPQSSVHSAGNRAPSRPTPPNRPASRPQHQPSPITTADSPFPQIVQSTSIFQMADQDGQVVSEIKNDMSERDFDKSRLVKPEFLRSVSSLSNKSPKASSSTTSLKQAQANWTNGFDNDPFTAVPAVKEAKSDQPKPATTATDAWGSPDFDPFNSGNQPQVNASSRVATGFNPFGADAFSSNQDSNSINNTMATTTPSIANAFDGFANDPFPPSNNTAAATQASLQEFTRQQQLQAQEDEQLRQVLERSKHEQ